MSLDKCFISSQTDHFLLRIWTHIENESLFVARLKTYGAAPAVKIWWHHVQYFIPLLQIPRMQCQCVLSCWIIFMRSWCNIFEKLDNLFSGKKFLVIININCSDHWIRPQLGTSSSNQIKLKMVPDYMLRKNYYYKYLQLQFACFVLCLWW